MYACIGEREGERVKLLQMPVYLLKEHHLRLPCHSRTITITHLPYTHTHSPDSMTSECALY